MQWKLANVSVLYVYVRTYSIRTVRMQHTMYYGMLIIMKSLFHKTTYYLSPDVTNLNDQATRKKSKKLLI